MSTYEERLTNILNNIETTTPSFWTETADGTGITYNDLVTITPNSFSIADGVGVVTNDFKIACEDSLYSRLCLIPDENGSSIELRNSFSDSFSITAGEGKPFFSFQKVGDEETLTKFGETISIKEKALNIKGETTTSYHLGRGKTVTFSLNGGVYDDTTSSCIYPETQNKEILSLSPYLGLTMLIGAIEGNIRTNSITAPDRSLTIDGAVTVKGSLSLNDYTIDSYAVETSRVLGRNNCLFISAKPSSAFSIAGSDEITLMANQLAFSSVPTSSFAATFSQSITVGTSAPVPTFTLKLFHKNSIFNFEINSQTLFSADKDKTTFYGKICTSTVPTEDADIANKAYVDAAIAAALGG